MNNHGMTPQRLRRLTYAALYLAIAMVLPFVKGKIPERINTVKSDIQDAIKTEQDTIEWAGHFFHFLFTPGHSYGSVCINLEDLLFTGDTIMPYKPYFNGRDSNEDDWINSVNKVLRTYSIDTTIYPGHGGSLTISDWEDLFNNGLSK